MLPKPAANQLYISTPVNAVCTVSRKNILYTTKYVSVESIWEEVRNSRAQYLNVPIIPGEVVAVHVFLCRKI